MSGYSSDLVNYESMKLIKIAARMRKREIKYLYLFKSDCDSEILVGQSHLPDGPLR